MTDYENNETCCVCEDCFAYIVQGSSDVFLHSLDGESTQDEWEGAEEAEAGAQALDERGPWVDVADADGDIRTVPGYSTCDGCGACTIDAVILEKAD